jgi:hypothetical protein
MARFRYKGVLTATALCLAGVSGVLAGSPDVRPPREGFLPMDTSEAPWTNAFYLAPAPNGALVAVEPQTQKTGTTTPNTKKAEPMSASSRLEIVRFVDGEFAVASKSLPGAKKGFHTSVGKPIDEHALQQALANTGTAVAAGDTVQITRIDFRPREIQIDINGGSNGHFRLSDHLQIGMGGGMPTSTTTSGAAQQVGATLLLDYGKAVPDMSPDDLKRDLSPFLNFEKQKSAAVNWIDTLPVEYRNAIKDERAVVGMDHDMVIAALGRPDHKVREKNDKGDDTEDWIYGNPPGKTVFVTFLGDKVVKVEEFN